MSGRPIGTRASEPPNPGEEHLALEGAPVDRLRFRPDRHAAEELEHVQLLLDMLMGADRVHAPVLDFSERGLGIAAPSGVELVAGQRIDEVRVQAGRYELYRGPARVVEQSGRPDRRGLALLGTHLDVDLLFGIDRRAGQLGVIEDALRPVLGALAGAEVPASFRAVVADLATVLGALHAELGAAKLEPPDLDDLEALVAPSFLHLVAELDRTAVGALGPVETSFRSTFVLALVLLACMGLATAVRFAERPRPDVAITEVGTLDLATPMLLHLEVSGELAVATVSPAWYGKQDPERIEILHALKDKLVAWALPAQFVLIHSEADTPLALYAAETRTLVHLDQPVHLLLTRREP